MKKIERLLAIIILLLDHEVVSATELAERFSVSKRTIFRDIQHIEHAGFPVVSLAGRNGGFSLIQPFKLRTLTYSGEEKNAILDAIQVREELLGVTDEASVIKEKIQALLIEATPQAKQIRVQSATIHRPEIEASIQKKIRQVKGALQSQNKLDILYVDTRGEFSRRTIQPSELLLMNGSWYLYAFCELRGEPRYFKLTRMREIIKLKQTFDPVAKTNNCWLESQDRHVTLQFERHSLGRLYDYFLDEEITLQDQLVMVTFDATRFSSLISLLLVFGKEVQVLQPRSLRQRHQQAIEELQQTYQNDK